MSIKSPWIGSQFLGLSSSEGKSDKPAEKDPPIGPDREPPVFEKQPRADKGLANFGPTLKSLGKGVRVAVVRMIGRRRDGVPVLEKKKYHRKEKQEAKPVERPVSGERLEMKDAIERRKAEDQEAYRLWLASFDTTS